jgi:hypothetical protein
MQNACCALHPLATACRLADRVLPSSCGNRRSAFMKVSSSLFFAQRTLSLSRELWLATNWLQNCYCRCSLRSVGREE